MNASQEEILESEKEFFRLLSEVKLMNQIITEQQEKLYELIRKPSLNNKEQIQPIFDEIKELIAEKHEQDRIISIAKKLE